MSDLSQRSCMRALRGYIARCFVAALTLVAGPVLAEGDYSLGVGGGAWHGRVDCVPSFSCDRSGGFGKIFAGYRVRDTVDVQAVYFGGSSFRGGDTTPLGTQFGGKFRVDGIGLTAGGMTAGPRTARRLKGICPNIR